MKSIVRNKGLPRFIFLQKLTTLKLIDILSRVLTLFLVLMLFINGCQLISANVFQASGTFPNEPFNGLQITYSVSGARISSPPEDIHDFTTVRRYKGALGDGQLSISGSVKALNGYFADVTMEVWAGDQKQTKTVRIERSSTDFNLSVRIPTTAASGGFSISCVGHYNAGTRGLQVVGYFSMMAPPQDTSKHEEAPLSDAVIFKRILDSYMSKIPKGMVTGGFTNNVLSFLDSRFKEYTCGGYQGKVLAFLDAIKWSKDPKERALLDKFDYGPIQAYYGGHQAVVIYPKGTNWIETGTILDPWPTQSPKTYTIQEWAVRFGMGSYHGIGASSPYEKFPEYPTVGGVYQDPSNRRLAPNERDWYKNQPSSFRDRIDRYATKDPNLWRHLIRNAYNSRNRTGQISIHCPVDVRLRDSSGRVTGFNAKDFRAEIPDVLAARMPDGKGGWITWFEYPENIDCELVIKANDNGKVEAFFGHGAGPVNTTTAFRYNFNAVKGQKFNASANRPGVSLQTETGTISPTRVENLAQLNAGNSSNTPTNPATPPAIDNPPTRNRTESIFDNGNIYGVENGPLSPTRFTLTNESLITEITTYHWNNAQGMRPGTIALVEKGTKRTFGPWQAIGMPGYKNAPNVYWVVKPNITLPAGTYRVVVSSPETWSHNQQSNNSGFVKVVGQIVR
ncbi:MAG: hypothetical protein IPK14_28000 [Blastocatellia bacterium]|nr:hypothetical protein [Blastocatellia bacterium]